MRSNRGNLIFVEYDPPRFCAVMQWYVVNVILKFITKIRSINTKTSLDSDKTLSFDCLKLGGPNNLNNFVLTHSIFVKTYRLIENSDSY